MHEKKYDRRIPGTLRRPLFLKVNPSEQGLNSNQKVRVIKGFQVDVTNQLHQPLRLHDRLRRPGEGHLNSHNDGIDNHVFCQTSLLVFFSPFVSLFRALISSKKTVGKKICKKWQLQRGQRKKHGHVSHVSFVYSSIRLGI